MNCPKSLQNEISQMREDLKNEAVELLDFDRIMQMLDEVQSTWGEHEKLLAELEDLKQDCRRRTIGMLKAVMAGRAKDGDAELAAALADDKHPLDGRELLALHKKISARFRDSFPASFKFLTGRMAASSGGKNWLDHKL